MKKERIFRYTLCLVLCLILLAATIPMPSRAVDDTWIANAAKELRQAMVAREGEVTFTYEAQSWIFSAAALEDEAVFEQEVDALLHEIYRQAVAHTGVPNEGDYLLRHISVWGCGAGYRGEKGGAFQYTFQFAFQYYTTQAQENAVTAKVQEVRSQLNLAGKSEYEKIRAIYDYLCDNVVYDNANLNDPSYNLKYSAYAALINGTSVCQGYSNLFYRLALEEGIDCRIIFGTSQGVNHSWNIVKLGGVYYNLDATWDAVTKDHRYFLKTDAHMDDHTKDVEYTQAAFLAAYPMAASDYVIPGNTTPVTPPPSPEQNQQPDTTPTTPTVPPTEPETQPSQPSSEPETEPPTEPNTEPASTEPSTVPAEESVPETSPSTAETQHSTTESPDSSGKEEEEKSDSILVLALGGVALLGAAAGAAALLSKKRR